MTSAPFGRRLLALLIDWILATLVAMVLSGSAYLEVNPWLTLGVFFVEVTLLTGLLGFSIGKRVVGLKVEGADGEPVGLLRATLRTGLLCLVVPALVQNAEHRGFHEIVSESRVVRS